MIEVTRKEGSDPIAVDVVVRVGKGATRHAVTVEPETVGALAAGRDVEELVRASFEFLLEREPKEAIMSRFELSVIGRYFPEYEEEIGNYLR